MQSIYNNTVQNVYYTPYFFWNNISQNKYHINKITDKDVTSEFYNFTINEMEQFNDSLELIPSENETFKEFNSSFHTEVSNLSKQQIDVNSDSNTNLKFVKYLIGETIRMRCIIPEGPYVIMWNKIGEEYPLTIGNHRFFPDKRISVRHKSPDKWILRITKAKLTDSGLYTCTAKSIHREDNITNIDETNYQQRINETMNNKYINNPDYYISVVESQSLGEKSVNSSMVPDNFIFKNRTLTVTGPSIVYYGSPLELRCYAKFSSNIQKSNYQLILDWYHHGVRRTSDPYRSGGVYIEQKWLNSNTLESRLFIKWPSESDTGQWICLERYKPIENNTGYNFSSHMVHLSSSTKSLLSMNKIQNDHLPVSVISKNRSPSSTFIPSSRIMFGRIEVEIVDVSKASIHLQAVKSKDTKQTHSYIRSNSKLLQLATKNISHTYIQTKWYFVSMCLLSTIILTLFL
ncbi:hypothetical protein MN116_007756 [Schistosoma mekongi]|uniref:Ig-like domain-containing protein n=1 Tax=Schistosoma mekongi TaxID=38744 RepID=A0AAE1Z6M2_SCHME|nr:hypothetical protein MN116_007756 [Schistosoma mekongi]